MMSLISLFITALEFWLLFTICYSLSKKNEEGEYLIDKKLTVFTIMLLGIVYFLINIGLFF